MLDEVVDNALPLFWCAAALSISRSYHSLRHLRIAAEADVEDAQQMREPARHCDVLFGDQERAKDLAPFAISQPPILITLTPLK